MRSTLTIDRTTTALGNLVSWVEEEEIGMCFAGSGWSQGAEFSAALGAKRSYRGSEIEGAIDFCKEANDMVCCHLNYEVKDQLERLSSRNADLIAFPLYAFFVPQIIIEVDAQRITLHYHPDDFSEGYLKQRFTSAPKSASIRTSAPIAFHRMDEQRYMQDIDVLQQHIQRGDVYQANYCQAFVWDPVEIDPVNLFLEGFDRMANPFSVYYRNKEHRLLSFSPERFLHFESGQVMSQPMKGTSPRDPDPVVDRYHFEQLKHSEKDRRENVMIVDLVRNDLSHFATKGSVNVPELYTIDRYPRVHQMHSTVTASIPPDVHPLQVLLKAFPMGSMTGAPKVSAMRILEHLEHNKRGVYSGTVGFIRPDGSGDFNVVIRSLVYNAANRHLSCHAGGGITDLSDPEAEYEECLVKVRPLFDLVSDHFEKKDPSLPLKGAAAAS